jgi:1-acyl-sn-glycerol-3-phosphate acyltransferase
MRFVVSAYYWLVFTSSLLIGLGVCTLWWLFTAPFDSRRRAVHALICAWGHQYMRVWPLWNVRITGREKIPPTPCIIVANHQSMADIIAVLGLYRQFKFVSKASLFKVPVLGWMMRMARYVAVERGRPHSTQHMMDECRAWLRSGMSVMIFPEGTYSTGELLPFKPGAFRLAVEEKVPLVPVFIEGTPQLIWQDGPWLSPRARIRVTVQEPISGATDADALCATVRARYQALRRGETSPSTSPSASRAAS